MDRTKTTLGHSVVSLAIFCSRCVCSVDLNILLFDIYALCKCWHLTLHKPFNWEKIETGMSFRSGQRKPGTRRSKIL